MANQTVTTAVNYDDAAIAGLLNGESIAIDGGTLTINADVRNNQQAAVPGNITISSTLGGILNVDGTNVWELHFNASTGNVPTQNALGSNGVTGAGGATGELTRVWAAGSLTPEPAGGAMPTAGWIKLRSKTGNFANGEVVTLPGGATITLTGAGKRSWIELPGAKSSFLTVPHLGQMNFTGDWYEIGSTDGSDDQILQLPAAFEAPAVQVETAAGSGVYEWWANAAVQWNGQINSTISTSNNVTVTADFTAGAAPAYHHGRRVRELAINSTHTIATELTTNGANISNTNIVFSAYVKKDTRQFCAVVLNMGSIRYGALVDLDAGTITANPSNGVPVNPASSITAINNGWYLVTVSMDKTTTSNMSGIVALSNSGTPVYSSAIPTYTGVATEGLFVGDLALTNGHAVQYVSSTDNRGKFFYGNPNTGELTFAKRTNGTAGLKPANGCKVRIPNIFLTSASSANWDQNEWNYTPSTSNYQFRMTGAGAYKLNNVSSYWQLSSSAAPFSVTLTDSAFSLGITISSAIGPIAINNCVVASTKGSFGVRVTASSAQDTVTFNNSRFVKWLSDTALTISTSNNITIEDCSFELFSTQAGVPTRTTGSNSISMTNVKNVLLDNTASLGGAIAFATSSDVVIKNTRYADLIIGASVTAGTNNALFLSSTSNVIVNHLYPFDDLPDINPVLAFIRITSLSSNISVWNVGTVSAPWICSTANVQQAIQFVTSTGSGFDFKRIYIDGSSTTGISELSTSADITATNIWVDAAESQVHRTQKGLFKGCRWTVSTTPASGVYGTHWDESFTSTTTGQFTIMANEPLPTTTSQCLAQFSSYSGFTGTGSAILKELTDSITWTYPDYALGHTSIANQVSGVSCFNVIGTNTQAFEFSYQIDKNTGSFSAWKHLVNSARQQSGGASGTNTLVIQTADETALIRKPQIGDYIQTVSGILPAGTTISNVSGTSITTDNNFTISASAGELFYFWSDIADEVISPTTGFKLKVKVDVNVASSSNVLSMFFIPTDTNAVDYKTQYPLPYDGAGIISNLESGSRIQIYNETTSTELYNSVVNASSYTFNYYQGTTVSDGDTIRIRISKLGKLPQTLLAIADDIGFAATSNAQEDAIYVLNGIDGSTVTEFTADYPNIDLDINDPDGTTTVQRVYAWLRYVETTVDGIAQWFDVVTATDEVNYEINTDLLDLKLDNTQATPVKIIGGRFYRSDGNTIIETTSGSIQLDPNRVYVIDGISTTQDAYNNLADTFLRRSTANAESSSFGDPLSLKSMYGMVAQGTHNTYVNNNNKLVVTKSDESTQLGTRSITNSPNAQPITGLDSD